MKDIIDKLLDPYELKARLFPSLITVAPLVIVYFAFNGKAPTFSDGILSSLLVFSFFYLLMTIARSRGKSIEKILFTEWGEKPSTLLLRHRDNTLNHITKEKYHNTLSKFLNKPFPNSKSEERDPAKADAVYNAAIHWLIENTRDKEKFHLLKQENIAYGFHRNLLGLKPIGIFLSTISIVLLLFKADIFTLRSPFFSERITKLDILSITAMGILFLIFLAWIFFVRKSVVKRYAFIYAERLLQSCEILSEKLTH
jgi:hypothetical protein